MANPYVLAGASNVGDVQVDRTFVFGDSYSATQHGGVDGWINFLKRDGKTKNFTNFAIGGARARSTVKKSFDAQINAFKNQDKKPNGRDLTVAYFGYNDLGARNTLQSSFDDYKTGLNQLRNLGVTNKNQRLFVTLLHDWGRNPAIDDSLRSKALDWNKKIIAYVNNHDRVVAVDMFTPFERIFKNPGKFGFTNVTSADPGKADSTALFADGAHFGKRGQKIISQIYSYYLTRGWDFSNNLAAGSAATAKLNQDLDKGLVFSLADKSEPLRFFQLGEGDSAPLEGKTEGMRTDFRTHFAEGENNGGIGMAYALNEGFDIGVTLSRYDVANDIEKQLATNEARVEQKAVSFYGQTKFDSGDFGQWQSRTRVTWAENEHLNLSQDTLLGSRNRARTEGQSFVAQETVSGMMRGDGFWLQPWADVTYSEQQIDGYRIANDYLGDTIYGGNEASELWTSIGLAARLDSFEITNDHNLDFTARAAYARSLYREDYAINVREIGLLDQSSVEEIKRGNAEILTFGLAGTLKNETGLEINGNYDLQLDQNQNDNHSIKFDLTYRF